MKCSAFGQKGVIYIWKSVDAILEDVAVGKTIVWRKNINQKSYIFLYIKIYGNPINVTYYIVAVKSYEKNVRYPKTVMPYNNTWTHENKLQTK